MGILHWIKQIRKMDVGKMGKFTVITFLVVLQLTMNSSQVLYIFLHCNYIISYTVELQYYIVEYSIIQQKFCGSDTDGSLITALESIEKKTP